MDNLQYKDDNIFAKIIKNEIPAYKVYEDHDNLVILDAFPKAYGHLLVIPKKNSVTILDMEDVELSSVIKLVKLLAQTVVNCLAADGVKVIHNCGKSAGQEVFHAHFHIVPYYSLKINKNEQLDSAALAQFIANNLNSR